jgi:hypothetical protein
MLRLERRCPSNASDDPRAPFVTAWPPSTPTDTSMPFCIIVVGIDGVVPSRRSVLRRDSFDETTSASDVGVGTRPEGRTGRTDPAHNLDRTPLRASLDETN